MQKKSWTEKLKKVKKDEKKERKLQELILEEQQIKQAAGEALKVPEEEEMTEEEEWLICVEKE
jgi:hypothetical protein